jgi:23S rRNA (guanosine2251-2'-O)-methyltransferase
MIKKKKQVKGELIYGIHPLIEVLKVKRRKVLSIYTTKPLPKTWKKIEKWLPSYPIAIQYVTREILNKMVDSSDHQGIVAWVQSFPFRKKAFDSKTHPFIVMLDSIQDSRNAGAILRSAYCTGASGIIMTIRNSAPLNAATFKASAGLAEYLEIQQVNTAAEGLIALKNAGYTNYLAMLKGTNVTKIELNLPLCMVIGNEAVGISESMLQYGTAITLPQKTADVSYNASVAAGILLFMIGTQRNLI